MKNGWHNRRNVFSNNNKENNLHGNIVNIAKLYLKVMVIWKSSRGKQNGDGKILYDQLMRGWRKINLLNIVINGGK